MKLPKRAYYPLSEAATLMGCGVRDVIHFGAIDALDFYVFINKFDAPGESWFHLNIPNNQVDNIDFFGCLSGDGWMLYDVAFKKKSDGFYLDGYYAKSISGLFNVNGFYLQPLEFSDSCNLETTVLSSHPEDEDYLPVDVNLIGFNLSIGRDYLCVLGKDIDKFMNIEEKNVSQTVASNQSQMIKALLYIHYGEEVANKPRKFFDDNESEVCKDFQLRGMGIPSGKTVAAWLKDVDINFMP